MQDFNQGHSITIRRIQPEDSPILLQAYKDESFIHLYRSNHTHQTEEQLSDSITKYAEYNFSELGYVELMIEHKQHGIIGIAILSDYNPLHKRAEYLIGLFASQHRSLGYGTEATLLVLDLAFNHYELNKIYTYVYGYNESSETNTLKFGFKQEGLLEEHHYLLNEQRFIDLYLNGMTVNNFRHNNTIKRYAMRLLGRNITLAPNIVKLTATEQLPDQVGEEFLAGLLSTNIASP
ncbi:MAG: GNAT family N-acetyltransferase [Candidatus Marithrix sp.]|nr:GNAT family N-acetyltransferase [Candidatus Marithrix sp.]